MNPFPVMASPPTESLAPSLYIIDGFLIETYLSIADVPYASVSDQRGKSPKTSEHERFDELYGRCRTCMGHKSGEQLLLCDDCDRGFHMTCLVPVLRDVPKGEWHCPKCTRDRVYNAHARATAVVNLRKVLRDIETRASLPLKIQLKMLNIAQPIVKCTRAAPSNHTTSEQIPNNNDQQPRFKLKSLPPKFRLKTSVKRQLETRIPIVEEAESPVMCKQIVGKSVQKRMRHLCTLAEELAPLAHRVTDADISNNLLSLHQRLHPHNEYREQPVAGTRTSYNVLSRANKRHRMDRPQVPVKSDPDARQQLHDTEVDDKLKCVSCPVDVRNSRHRSGGFISNGNGSTLENQFRKTKGYADGIPFPADPDEVAYVHRGLRKVEN